MKHLFLILTILLFTFSLFGQRIGFEQIDDSKVTDWIPKFEIEYSCVYHFGDSEMESDFVLIATLNDWYAQIRTGSFNSDGTAWIWHYENLTDVKVVGNEFYSNKTNGEFVIYGIGKENIKGLKVYDSWSGMTEPEEYEIGTKSYTLKKYFAGKYPQASMTELSEEELTKMSKTELKIMRNEIFARYGYIFKSGGEMEKYFKSQDWYVGQHENVNSFLTELERANIQLITSLEN